MFIYARETDPFVTFRLFGKTLPQPLATVAPVETLPLYGRFAFVAGTATPPFSIFRTFAALVFDTTVLPLAPSLFFLRAVVALWLFERLFALLRGKQRSGFFLSFEVPHLPLMLPELSILTQS